MTRSDTGGRHTPPGGLDRRQFVAVVGLFWIYVTLSNVVYAYSMRTGVSRATNEPLFAPWDMRVLQHVLLFPLVLVSFWASLRVNWRPLWAALPLQILLGAAFASVAFPMMLVAQAALGGADWQHHMMDYAHLADPFYRDPTFLSMWLASFVGFLPSYGFGLALVTGITLYSRVRDSEMRVAALERDWNAARLSALRMQLSPHTLFNLLHTIRGHIEWDPNVAQSMVVQLADLLRRLLSAGERDFSALAEELQFVRQYLELQQRRFEDRLHIVMPPPSQIPAVWVPSLILQPLVENAVVHGLAGHQGPVEVSVSIAADPESVSLRISNTLTPGAPPGVPGIGLKNVRERLAVHFGERAHLTAGPQGAVWESAVVLPAVGASPERHAARDAPTGEPA